MCLCVLAARSGAAGEQAACRWHARQGGGRRHATRSAEGPLHRKPTAVISHVGYCRSRRLARRLCRHTGSSNLSSGWQVATAPAINADAARGCTCCNNMPCAPTVAHGCSGGCGMCCSLLVPCVHHCLNVQRTTFYAMDALKHQKRSVALSHPIRLACCSV